MNSYFITFFNKLILLLYGANLIGNSMKVPLLITDFLWVNTSKLALPWYAPIPLEPTPPKGKYEDATWIIVSFIVTPPDVV